MPIHSKICTWTCRGLHVTKWADCEPKLKVLQQLLEVHDLVLIQESHITPAVWEHMQSWAWKRGICLLGKGAHSAPSGLLAAVRLSDAKWWSYEYLERDSIQLLRNHRNQSDGGEVINCYLSPKSGRCRLEQVELVGRYVKERGVGTRVPY